MKNLFLTISMLCATLSASAQTVDHGGPVAMWTVPAVFSVDQKVTFYFDMTDSGFKPGTDLYLWCWNPSEPDAGNWENSSDFAHLDYQGDNIYTMTMVPTEYFSSGAASGKTPQEIYDYCQTADWPGFWCRLKTKDGSEESDVFQAPDSRSEWTEIAESSDDYYVYSGIKSTGFKPNFTLDKPLTILFDGDKFTVGGKTMNEFAQTAGFESFNLHSGLNDWTYLQGVKVWIADCLNKTKIEKLSNGFWSISMTTPADYWGWQYADDGSEMSNNLEPDAEIENLAWLVVGIVNGDWGGTCADHSTKAGTAAPYPDPILTIFPSRFTLSDIITISRQWNERTSGVLQYIITVGNKAVEGSMKGSRDKYSATVSLLGNFDGLNATEIEIVVKNESGAEVERKTLQLYTED